MIFHEHIQTKIILKVLLFLVAVQMKFRNGNALNQGTTNAFQPSTSSPYGGNTNSNNGNSYKRSPPLKNNQQQALLNSPSNGSNGILRNSYSNFWSLPAYCFILLLDHWWSQGCHLPPYDFKKKINSKKLNFNLKVSIFRLDNFNFCYLIYI